MSPALAGGFFTTVLRGLHQIISQTIFGGVLSPVVSQKKVAIFFKGTRANEMSILDLRKHLGQSQGGEQ